MTAEKKPNKAPYCEKHHRYHHWDEKCPYCEIDRLEAIVASVKKSVVWEWLEIANQCLGYDYFDSPYEEKS